jgi:hypothetical protein
VSIVFVGDADGDDTFTPITESRCCLWGTYFSNV